VSHRRRWLRGTGGGRDTGRDTGRDRCTVGASPCSGANDSGIRVQQSLSLSLPPSLPRLAQGLQRRCQGVGAK